MARCILMTGGGGGVMSEDTTVAAEDVLEGKTYLGSDTDDEIGVGTMPNNDSFSSTLNCGQSILIPRGYHTGSGKIVANSLASQTPGNATAASMLNGRIGWVDGKKITGTIPSQGAATFSPSKGTTKTIITSGKYTSGDIKLAGFNMPDPSKLAKGYTYTLYGQSVTGTAVLAAMGDGSSGPYRIIGNRNSSNNKYEWSNVIKGGANNVINYPYERINSYVVHDDSLEGRFNGGWVRFLPSMYFEQGKYKYCRLIGYSDHDDVDEGEVSYYPATQYMQIGLSTNPNVSSISQCEHILYNQTVTGYNDINVNTFIDISKIPSNYYFLFCNLVPNGGGQQLYVGVKKLFFTNSTSE